jgi:hypothetical protein
VTASTATRVMRHYSQIIAQGGITREPAIRGLLSFAWPAGHVQTVVETVAPYAGLFGEQSRNALLQLLATAGQPVELPEALQLSVDQAIEENIGTPDAGLQRVLRQALAFGQLERSIVASVKLEANPAIVTARVVTQEDYIKVIGGLAAAIEQGELDVKAALPLGQALHDADSDLYAAVVEGLLHEQISGDRSTRADSWTLLLAPLDEDESRLVATPVIAALKGSAGAVLRVVPVLASIRSNQHLDAIIAADAPDIVARWIKDEPDVKVAAALASAMASGPASRERALASFGRLGPRKAPMRDAFAAAKQALKSNE